jgi:hypothetical protein
LYDKANQNWNKMAGGGRPAGGLILGDRQASGMLGYVLLGAAF